MPTRKVTIEDISQQTGLSRGTVSRALNDRPDISQKTKQRVFEACRTLNYVPSHAARSLATGRNLAVLAVVQNLEDAFSSRLLRGVLAQAESQHYGVYLLELGDAEVAEQRLRTLSGERIDAVLLGSPLSEAQGGLLREALGARRLISTTVLPGEPNDVLGPDLPEAGRLAVRHARELGGRIQVLVRTEDDLFLQGAREEAGGEAAGMVHEVHGMGDERLAQLVGDADVIATSCDRLAQAVYPLVWQSGRAVGSQVKILGSGNSPCAEFASPGLSSIDLGAEEIGRRSLELVLQRIAGSRQDGPQRIAVAPRLVARASTGAG